MKRLLCAVGLLGLMNFGVVTALQAQRAGPGVVMDWIHKLSGPALRSEGYTVWLWPFESRADSVYRTRSDGDVSGWQFLGKGALGFEFGQTWGSSTDLKGAQGEADSLKYNTINLVAHYMVARHRLLGIGLSGGVSSYNFRVEDSRSSNQSYTLQLALHLFPDVPLYKKSFVLYPVIRGGSGFSRFGTFAQDPFGPIDTDVSVDGGEWAWSSFLQLGLIARAGGNSLERER